MNRWKRMHSIKKVGQWAKDSFIKEDISSSVSSKKVQFLEEVHTKWIYFFPIVSQAILNFTDLLLWENCSKQIEKCSKNIKNSYKYTLKKNKTFIFTNFFVNCFYCWTIDLWIQSTSNSSTQHVNLSKQLNLCMNIQLLKVFVWIAVIWKFP